MTKKENQSSQNNDDIEEIDVSELLERIEKNEEKISSQEKAIEELKKSVAENTGNIASLTDIIAELSEWTVNNAEPITKFWRGN